MKGENLIIYYSIFKTKFGLCLVASTVVGICNILFADTKEDLQNDLQLRLINATFIQKSLPIHLEIKKFLEGNTLKTKIRLHLYGTDFQIKIWKTLLQVPFGKTNTYAGIAELIGDRKKTRAVGTAIGSNPVGYIIPCHRILRSDGGIGGYRWGIDRKQSMLKFESMYKS